MSKFVFYIKLQPFVAQWLVHSFGSPVVFPPQSVENSTIRRFIRKRPLDVLPDTAAPGLTAICIPDSTQTPPEIYNYLGLMGKKAVEECIEDNFRLSMWSELNDLHDIGCSVMTAIYAWCDKHGIDYDYALTVRQRYYRLRDSYLKYGIDFRHRTRNHNRT